MKKTDIETTDNETVSVASADLSSITEQLTAEMPDVQEHALEQESINENEKVEQFSHLVDKNGNAFDPSIHKTNATGEPTTSVKGLLVLKPGRKGGTDKAQTTVKTSSVVGVQTEALKAQEIRRQARASGAMAGTLLIQLGVICGGEEWYPRKEDSVGLDEELMLKSAFADYFEATGKVDIPPGLALTLAVTCYVGPRFTMPKTQKRVTGLFGGIKKWWINRKLKKHGMKVETDNQDKPAKMAA